MTKCIRALSGRGYANATDHNFEHAEASGPYGACFGMSSGRVLLADTSREAPEPETGIEIGWPGESFLGAAANDAHAGREDEPDLTDVAAEFVWVMAPTRATSRGFGTMFRTGFISLLVHLAVVGLILRFIQAPAPIAELQETAVEIVQEAQPAPKPPEEAAKKAGLEKVEQKASEPPKPEAPPEKPKQEDVKQVQPAGKPPDVAKAEPPQSRPNAAKDAEDAKALQAMQDELASLKAQKDGLQKQVEAAEEQAQREAALAQTAADTAKALGPLPQSFQAIALPGGAATGEDTVTYQQQVFSQLAKAKKAGRHVVSPGIAHVVFHIDAAGKLLDVTLDHPSGDAFLDDEAVAIVRRAAPFPPPPPGEQRAFSASMKFVIEE